MRNTTIMLMGVLLIAVGMLSPAKAQMVTWEEAFDVAQNWIALIIEKEGNWGGAETAQVYEVHDFTRGGLLLGYFCRVQPSGYIVVSLRKELAPVQAYSDTGDIDPESGEGMVGISKEEMERILMEIDMPPKPGISIQSQTPEDDPRLDWEKLGQDPQTFPAKLESGAIVMDYEGGDSPLLTSAWDQGDPYNQQCPVGSCMPCPVGCTPLAGAQIMRYWAWPPDQFDWANMPDTLDSHSYQTQIDAVARLCADVGNRVGAVYCIAGKCETFALLCCCPGCADLLDEFEDHYRYSDDADEDIRITESGADWFKYFKEDLALNRPVPYEMGTGFHTVVCDGWKQTGSTRYLRLNYGWGGKNNQWWGVDKQPNRGPGENIIRYLHPDCTQGSALTGESSILPGVYAYFDQDAVPSIFVAGTDAVRYTTDCQFLPGVRVGSAGAGEIWAGTTPVEFAPYVARTTRLFSIKGTSTASIKVMQNGLFKLSNGGKVRFH
jgi:hypothetical protein